MVKEIYSASNALERKRLFDIDIDPTGVEWWVFKQGKGKAPIRVRYDTLEPQIAEVRNTTER